jgi:acyl carrier protein
MDFNIYLGGMMTMTTMAEMQKTNSVATIPHEAVEQKVCEFVAQALDLEVDEVQLSSALMGELDAESLDILDIAYMIEREFKIGFPRDDIVKRSRQVFGEDSLVVNGRVTDLGVELLRKSMPELDPNTLQPGMLAVDIARMFSVQSLVRITERLLEAKAEFPKDCPACGEMMVESDIVPEFVCPKCDTIKPFPSGDDILLQDTIALAESIGVVPISQG